MNIIEAIILGIVQGITEFLPVSSSGHLKLAEYFLGFENLHQYLTFDIVCHFGTLFAILAVYTIRRPIAEYIPVLIGTLPLFPCVLLYKQIKTLFNAPDLLGFFFLTTSLLLFLGIRLGGSARRPLLQGENLNACLAGENLAWEPSQKNSRRDAFVIGLFQALALIPGISRSGSTISGARLLGWSQERSLEFSFLLAIPAILGGVAWESLQFLKTGHDAIQLSLPIYLSGFISSFVVGYASLKLLIKLAIKNRFMYFVWYTLILGISVLLYFNL